MKQYFDIWYVRVFEKGISIYFEHKCARRICMYVCVWKGQMAFEFYWISFCINFHRFFFILFLLLLSSFMDSLLFFSFFLSYTPENLVRSTFCPIGARVLACSFSICEIIRNNIWKSTSVYRWFHKLFTSYTTKYRHRYIDTRLGRGGYLCASLSNFFWSLVYGLVWFRYRSMKIHINCTLQYKCIEVEFVHKITHLLNFAKTHSYI